MTSKKSSTVTRRGGLFAALLLIGSAASAEPIGSVANANGLLLARAASGSIKVLVVGSRVEQGDTLFTREGTYALVKLSDQSSVALGPETELSVETYSFHEASDDPQDSASVKLARGRVRVSSGILGTRHPNSFTLSAGTTMIDIGRSTFVAEFVEPRTMAVIGTHPTGLYRNVSWHLAQMPAPVIPGGTGGLNPGLYVQVLDGMINIHNNGGAQNFGAGQFGFTPSFRQPPIILPVNPGIQFNPPPSFSSTTGGAQNGNGGAKPGLVDCVVR